jgi:AcrR family transcriptional regulator
MARTPKVVEDRREQIMDTALQLFAEKGFDRTTNKDIARAAGVTPGLIYHYFPSKDALLKAAITAYSPRQLLQVLPTEMLDLPPDAFLRLLAQRLLTILEEERFVRLIRVLLPSAMYNSAVGSFRLSVMHEVTQAFASALDAQMERGALRQTDPSLAIQLFAGSLMALVLRRQVLHDPVALQYSHEQIVEQVVTLMGEGLFPR